MRFFSRLKENKRIDMRFDKLDSNYFINSAIAKKVEDIIEWHIA